MQLLSEFCKKMLGFRLTEHQISQFRDYLTILQEWNQKFNLTAITSENEIIKKHFIDSLICLKAVSFSKNARILDVGTGGGFPGIPIKIIRPDLRMTLLETIGKKVTFLEQLVSSLNLQNVNIVKERAEILGHHPDYREKFDIVLSRALAPLPVSSELCLPFVKLVGYYLPMLGKDWENQEESAGNAVKELSGEIQPVYHLEESIVKSMTYILPIQKISVTPKKYPRKPGIPNKRPLR